ncbi:MAG: hypothetical protein WDO73_01720 [Ignavibacteriota bacterium]
MLSIAAGSALCQETAAPPDEAIPAAGHAEPPPKSHILGVIPNYRSTPMPNPYLPLTARGKLKIASEDALDPGTFTQAAAFAGLGQITNANRSYGQGVAGFARYFGSSCGDLIIGDYLTEGIYPVLLHQDPRYFQKGTGTGWSRFRYAALQIFETHHDSGAMQFNYSEVLGNATAVAISTSYYAANRSVGDAVSKFGTQLGVDMAGNILKEFWPDLQRKLNKKKHAHDAH